MGQEDSHLVRRERCPNCESRGMDRTGDNLAVYSDGHKFCYSCQHYEKGDLRLRLSRMIKPPVTLVNVENNDVVLPNDYTINIPNNVILWLRQFQISDYEIKHYKFGYSHQLERLIYPVYDANDKLLMWQGRYFGMNPTAAKYLTKGPASDTMYVVGAHHKQGIVIVVEDLLSAIKVGRAFAAMPIWGSNLSLKQLRKLQDRFSIVGVWLDPDKRRESLKTALWASQYVPSFAISSGKDPKYYMSSEITEFVDVHSRNMITKTEEEKELDKSKT